MADFKDAYNRYWEQRKAYQKADRESLDMRLKPEREALARAIRDEIDGGSSMTKLQEIAGSNNRNFLYSIMQGVPYLTYGRAIDNNVSVKSKNVEVEPTSTDELGWTYSIDFENQVLHLHRENLELLEEAEHYSFEYNPLDKSMTNDSEVYQIKGSGIYGTFTKPEQEFMRNIVAEINKDQLTDDSPQGIV